MLAGQSGITLPTRRCVLKTDLGFCMVVAIVNFENSPRRLHNEVFESILGPSNKLAYLIVCLGRTGSARSITVGLFGLAG